MTLPRPAPRLFGTDGMRAEFGVPPLDRATIAALTAALAATLRERTGPMSRTPRVILGGDTRASTPEICRWLAAGLEAGGVEVAYAGVIPTPGIAHLVGVPGTRGAVSGIAVSASHNPYPDNGVKLLDRDGRKWSDEEERKLEGRIAEILAAGAPATSATPGMDGAELVPDLAIDGSLRAEYLDHLAASLTSSPGARPLAGVRVVLDAGNGAASSYAVPLFERLGAAVTLIHARPDGRNVNDRCGSTAPQEMAARVLAAGADLGAAFDGDADRAILADETGAVRDGDAILYLWATHLKRLGELAPAKIVATSMSNLGLERALAREGIGVVRCDVGDRYVVEAMEREGIVLGGEQSGHIVNARLSTHRRRAPDRPPDRRDRRNGGSSRPLGFRSPLRFQALPADLEKRPGPAEDRFRDSPQGDRCRPSRRGSPG